MVDMQQLHDSVKVYVGSFFTAAGAAWTWLGTNYQNVAAVVCILAFVYTTIVFVQGQMDRIRKQKTQ